MEYWCGHSFLTVPLEVVLHDFVKFIKKHPTEVIIIDHRPDTRSFNGDYIGLASKRTSQAISLWHQKRMEDMTKYVIQEIGKQRIAFDFNADMTIEDITKKGKNIVLLLNG